MATYTREVSLSDRQSSMTVGLILGLVLIITMSVLIAELDAGISSWFKQHRVSKNPLEYPLVAVVLGLLINGILRLFKAHNFIRPAIRTELFLKIGLVIMGARVSVGQVMARGSGGLIQAFVMVISVFFFTWWLGGKMRISDKLRAVMSAAVSICGVSAAIAAAGAVVARKEEISYVSTLVIVTALPMMVLMPWVAHALGMPDAVAGAWFGGNIDTTAAVVGAGTIHGEVAQEVATVVKMSQNVLIGFAAFFLALYFALVVECKPDEKPSPRVIWQRFPKFVLGFVLVSILASFGLFSGEQVSIMKHLYKWAFAMAFFCIGLGVSLKDVGKMGWSPVIVYLVATIFNTLLAMGVAYIIFGALSL